MQQKSIDFNNSDHHVRTMGSTRQEKLRSFRRVAFPAGYPKRYGPKNYQEEN